ncbi:IS30 family (Tra8) [Fructobacillus cardui]|uniref:IS30 family transposase n=1 Tax=Fructobacillus cardui TaxID=2893170 RepID=UPI002DACD1BB|nr:IS30 family (Tra8) [Fructobacillus cardui]CAK1253793.1 IS30 family (Tra8) [Fructobacillus cardui]
MTEKLPKGRLRRPKLTEKQRYLIEYLWNDCKMSQVAIAEEIGMTQSTVSHELQKGNVLNWDHLPRQAVMSLSSHARIKYSSARGQYIATQRSIRHGEGSLFTPALKKTIEHWVNDEHWTPEQIASKVQSVDISASTIRNWIRHGMLDVKPYVYRRRKSNKLNKRETEIAEQQARKKEELAYLQEKLRDQNALIPRRISARSESVLTRKQFGHWEIDLVCPAKSDSDDLTHRAVILTLAERKTRYYVCIKLGGRTAQEVVLGMKAFYKEYGNYVRSITADNGSEFRNINFLQYVQKDQKTKVYYAHPSSPQERGTNEYKNRELRRYVPKKTTFSRLTQEELNKITDKINNKPMLKALDGDTPEHRFAKEVVKMNRYRQNYLKKKTAELDNQ